MSFKFDPRAAARPARAAAAVRDLALLAAGRGRAPAVRPGRPRRAALVGPPRGLPDRGARPGQGAGGEERGDRSGRRQGRVRLQAAARPGGRPRRVARRGRRLLPHVHLVDARHHRQPRRRRGRAAGRTWSATTATTPTSSSRPTRAPRRSPTSRTSVANDVRLLARRRVRLRRLGRLRPQGDGDHRARRVGVGAAPLPRDGPRLPDRGLHRASASATCPATCSATACCCRSTSGWSRRSTTGTSSSTRTRTRRPRSPSVVGCSTCRARPGQDYDAGADQRGRRRLPAVGEVDPDHPAGARRRSASPTTSSRCRRPSSCGRSWSPTSTCSGTAASARTSRPSTESQRRRRRQGERRDPGERRRAAVQGRSARAATSASPSSAGSSTPAPAGGSTPTRSTTPPASTRPTTRSTSRSCSTAWSTTASSPVEQRNELLASMTDEVAELVLADNYGQNVCIASGLQQGAALLHVHRDYIRQLEKRGQARPRARVPARPSARSPSGWPRTKGSPVRSTPCCSRTPR